MMESDTPSPPPSPNRADDSEVSSRGAPPGQQAVQETKRALPEAGASVPQGSEVKNDGPALSGLQPETILEASKQILGEDEGHRSCGEESAQRPGPARALF